MDNASERGFVLLEEGEVEQALQLFEELAALATTNDDRTAALIGEFRCLEKLGRFSEAEHALNEASLLAKSLDDEELQAWLLYLGAGLDSRAGQDAHALQKLRALFTKLRSEIDKGSQLYQDAIILLASTLLNLGRPRDALPVFKESVGFTTAQKPPDYDHRMAYCLALCGETDHAESILKAKLARASTLTEEETARYYLGLVYSTGNQFARALDEFRFCEKHIAEVPDLSPVSLMSALATVCEKLGKRDEAARYRRAAGKGMSGEIA